MKDMNELTDRLGYSFHDPSLLEEALTHSSYANEQKNNPPYNERLEFLGDSVLGLITGEYLYTHLPSEEGELTKLRASLVCEKALCGYSQELELGRFLRLGRGEQQNGGGERPSILADAFEAVLAAIYLDGGMNPARALVLPFITKELEQHRSLPFRDYKTLLQEIIQQNPGEQLRYVPVGESGPDHDKRFVIEVHLNSNVIGRGVGRNKKEAAQQAAREALKLMGHDE